MGCLHAAAKATEAAATEATEAATAAPCRIAGRPMQGVGLAKATTKLTAQERVILFCLATGISHTAVGITAHAMQSMAATVSIAHTEPGRPIGRCHRVRSPSPVNAAPGFASSPS